MVVRRGRDSRLRDDTRHDALVVTKQENAQRDKHACKVTVYVNQSLSNDAWGPSVHEFLPVQAVHTGRPIICRHDKDQEPFAARYRLADRIWYRDVFLPLNDARSTFLLCE